MALLKWTPFKAGITLIIASCVLWHGFGYEKPEFLTAIDNRIFDQMFRIRGAEPHAGSVVIVDIDEKSLRTHGQWPWPRDMVADLVQAIHESGALVTGFDVVFAERDRTTPAVFFPRYSTFFQDPSQKRVLDLLVNDPTLDHDIMLGDEIAKGTMVAGYAFLFKTDRMKNETEVPFPSIHIRTRPAGTRFRDITLMQAYRAVVNIPEVATASSEGFFNVFPAPSGTVRKAPLFIALDQIPYPSLAFEMMRLSKGRQQATLHASVIGESKTRPLLGVSLGSSFIPTDAMGQLTVNYRGPAYTFPYLSAADVMATPTADVLKGKYVLIGSSAAGIMDFVATPFSSIFPGVEVHATIIDNLIKNDPMVHENYTEIGLTYTIIAAGGLLMTLALVYLSPQVGSLTALFLLFIIVVGDYLVFFKNNQLVGVSYSLFTMLALLFGVTMANYFYEGKKRLFIRHAFSRYVSPSVVMELVKDPRRLSLSVEKKNVTIFFSDIRGFTTLSETLPSEQLGTFMNEYLTVISDIIMKHQGMVDKFIGDAVMAIWGTPLENPSHAEYAVTAALEITDALKHFSKQWEPFGISVLTGIGLNTGIVSAGNFGSASRFDYTVLGDHVNLASRLEGLNKVYGAQIIISHHTREALGDRFFCRYIDNVCVKGKTEAVALYEPLCKGAPDPVLRDETHAFNQAMEHYRNQEFQKARSWLTTLQGNRPDPLYALYLKRINEFRESPPGPGWKGIHILTSK
ncbi:guanylate cyclase [Desulfoluna limicola]|uniref:Guanylate cyclase n=1 Tax=Desulfoluna limicola TaxID=2810562 RepID=A0ABM7PDR5_9BACT|nr:adenylate/guanylate cyclase domain-containing protein [Desulfoluna limicola]BCS95402.1 guanylate cyclase [Desulfoluna limicola]